MMRTIPRRTPTAYRNFRSQQFILYGPMGLMAALAAILMSRPPSDPTGGRDYLPAPPLSAFTPAVLQSSLGEVPDPSCIAPRLDRLISHRQLAKCRGASREGFGPANQPDRQRW